MVRCLSAAAWKTICGRLRSKAASSASTSRMSHSRMSSLSSVDRPSIDSWVACSPLSSRSSMSSREGPNLAIWRQSSEPIEPPAPVTSTRLPPMWSAIAAMSRSTGWRPSRSATSRLRRSDAVGRPPSSSRTGGSTSTSRPLSRASADSSRTVSEVALGTAITKVVAAYFAAMHAMSSRVPRTRTPEKCSRALPRSSSSRATGTMPLAGSRTRLCMRMRAPEPAPKMMARLVLSPRTAWCVRRERMRNRAANMPMTARARAMSGTVRGSSTRLEQQGEHGEREARDRGGTGHLGGLLEGAQLMAHRVRAEQPPDAHVHDDDAHRRPRPGVRRRAR